MTEAIVLSLIIGFLRGGRLGNMAKFPIKLIILVFIALIIKYGADFLSANGYNWINNYTFYLQLISYLMLFIVLFLNRRLYGFKVVGLGTLLNFLVITANGGYMPVWSKVLPSEKINFLLAGKSTTHTLLNNNTKLKYLADIIYIPPPYPITQLISVGDFLISVGVFVFIQKGMMGVNYKDSFKFVNFNNSFK